MDSAMRWDWVADLYDSYVTAALDVPFFVHQASATKGDVLELMCGTGRVSLPLAEAGVRLTCVDSSAGMLARLRDKLAARGLSARVIQMDVRELVLRQQFELIILPFNSFGELTALADQQSALRGIYDHLRPGGRFICTLHNPRIRKQTADGQLRLIGRFPRTAQPGNLLVWTLATYDAASHLVEGYQFYEEYSEEGVLERKRLLEIRFALLERGEFEAQATAAGFTVTALYGDYEQAPFRDDSSPFMIWILTK